MADALDDLLAAHPHLWRGNHGPRHSATLPTGYAELDAVLPGGGWPNAAITEVIASDLGIGELRLLLPAMQQLRHAGRRIVWIAPPYRPYAPGLMQAGLNPAQHFVTDAGVAEPDVWWCTEKLLKSRACGMVLAWPSYPEPTRIRRLQLAAEDGATPAFLYLRRQLPSSPAALRLVLSAAAGGVLVHIIKARGGRSDRMVAMTFR